MKSPTTGEPMILDWEYREVKYKSVDLIYLHWYYLDGNEKYTTTELDTINMENLKTQYQNKL